MSGPSRSSRVVDSGSQSIPVANVTGDAAAITAALTSITTGGKASGRLATTQGRVARISTPTVLDLGYANTQDATTWDVDHTEKVKLSLDILPDAGLGAALTIKGGYGVELDLNVLGGGQRGAGTCSTTNGSTTVSNAAALITAGLKAGAVVFITGAGQQPEGVAQPLAASVRSVNVGAGTFVVSEAAGATTAGAVINWYDVAVRLEDHIGLKLNIYGESYEGCLLAADATDDATKRMRSVTFGRIHGNSCGRTIFWKSMEAHGSLGLIWSNTYHGDYFGLCADVHWTHYEGGVGPAVNQADTYLWLDRCNQMNNLSVSIGDRASEALVKMTGDSAGSSANVGRFSQIRCTAYMATATGDITSGSNLVTGVVTSALTMKVGQRITGPGIPDGTTITAVSGTGTGYTGGAPGTITMSANATATAAGQAIYGHHADGVKLIGVESVQIAFLDTARTIAGLRVKGGGGNGIVVDRHRSLTSDICPLVVEAGSIGTAPRVAVTTDYRFILGYALDIGAGLTGGDIRIPGHSENMHVNGGASGKYAVRCASAAATVDVAGHRQVSRTSLTAFADRTTMILRGRSRARLENDTLDGDGPAPLLHGMKLWSFDPVMMFGATALTAGALHLTKILVPEPTSVTNIIASITTAGATLTAGQCFAAIFDSTGALVGATADQAAAWATSGDKTMAIAGGPVTVKGPFVWVAYLANGTTPPQLARTQGLSSTSLNVGTSNATARAATNGTGLTAVPASITPSANTKLTQGYFAGLS